ncbi:collagen alpha-1(I) chain-like [Canis lupus familiaris]|uniref:collagen alpha-1(I) chain-like n=1 Tax=Canis lupus familiaris TaxID=9615 RepID=UPI0018F5593B|nr:collagen alpha-1(I) chain-like [Canis lupus familiaris]
MTRGGGGSRAEAASRLRAAAPGLAGLPEAGRPCRSWEGGGEGRGAEERGPREPRAQEGRRGGLHPGPRDPSPPPPRAHERRPWAPLAQIGGPADPPHPTPTGLKSGEAWRVLQETPGKNFQSCSVLHSKSLRVTHESTSKRVGSLKVDIPGQVRGKDKEKAASGISCWVLPTFLLVASSPQPPEAGMLTVLLAGAAEPGTHPAGPGSRQRGPPGSRARPRAAAGGTAAPGKEAAAGPASPATPPLAVPAGPPPPPPPCAAGLSAGPLGLPLPPGPPRRPPPVSVRAEVRRPPGSPTAARRKRPATAAPPRPRGARRVGFRTGPV